MLQLNSDAKQQSIYFLKFNKYEALFQINHSLDSKATRLEPGIFISMCQSSVAGICISIAITLLMISSQLLIIVDFKWLLQIWLVSSAICLRNEDSMMKCTERKRKLSFDVLREWQQKEQQILCLLLASAINNSSLFRWSSKLLCHVFIILWYLLLFGFII